MKINKSMFSTEERSEGVRLNKYLADAGVCSRRDAFNAKARAWYYGEVLRQRRKELNLTQKELAERVGKERAYISRLEQGETDLQLSSFIQIINALGLTIRLDAIVA